MSYINPESKMKGKHAMSSGIHVEIRSVYSFNDTLLTRHSTSLLKAVTMHSARAIRLGASTLLNESS